MGEILGLGISHYPGFMYDDDDMAQRLRNTLTSRKVPEAMRDPKNWPQRMQDEWGDDEGRAFAVTHRKEFVDGVRRLREGLDAFNPDAVVIFGDDQYENFREDLVPPFAVYIRDEFVTRPFARGRFGGADESNVWGLPKDWELRTPGSPDVARYLTKGLLDSDYPMPYSYQGHHIDGLGHAFANTVIYLDYDRQGWTYPVIPVHVNAYGSDVVRHRGGSAHLFTEEEVVPDPPAPSPNAAFTLGQLVGRLIKESPYRIAVIGSASWSHAFLTAKNHFVYPDLPSDELRYQQMIDRDWDALRALTIPDLEEAGQHELLNWMPFFGAMDAVGAVPTWSNLVRSYVMNSSKALAIFEEPT